MERSVACASCLAMAYRLSETSRGMPILRPSSGSNLLPSRPLLTNLMLSESYGGVFGGGLEKSPGGPARTPAVPGAQAYIVCMKRTNLVLDEHLLEELTRVSGERTYSRAVTKAMEDYLRRHRAGRILELAGSGLWEGDLSEMRGDAAATARPRR